MEILGAFIVGLVILAIIARVISIRTQPYRIDWKKEESEHRDSFSRRNKDIYLSDEKMKAACDLEFKAIRQTKHRMYHM